MIKQNLNLVSVAVSVIAGCRGLSLDLRSTFLFPKIVMTVIHLNKYVVKMFMFTQRVKSEYPVGLIGFI